MTFRKAASTCHVRSAIYRKSNPGARYWKNHRVPFVARISSEDRLADDWEEFDPRDHKECSEFNETPA